MADRIKGITVQIGGDTTGLKSALSGVNKEIKTTQSQLNDVEKLLKLDPTNTTLLTQKQELLGKAIGETKDKLTSLKDAQKQLDDKIASGVDVDQSQYDGLSREIIATEQSLKKLETAAESSNVTLQQVAATADKVASGASNVAAATSKLSTAAAGGLAAIGTLAYKSVTAADDLNTLAKQTGFTTDELQKMEYASDIVDVSVDSITSAATKMKKNMTSTSSDTVAAWNAIGVSVTDSNGNLRDSTEVFYEALQGLSEVGNETERDTLAMTLFGKGADELAGIIDDGGQALKDYGQQAEDTGVILDQDTLDSLNDINDQIDTFKANAAGSLSKAGAAAAETLAPALEKVVGFLTDVLNAIAGLDEGQMTAIATVLLVIAAISPVAGLISGISTVVGALTGTIGTVSAAIGIFTGAATEGSAAATALAGVMTFMTSPIFLVVAAITALIVIINLFGDQFQEVLQGADDFLTGIFETDFTEIFGPGLGDIINGFLAGFKSVWDSVKNILDGVIDIVRGVFTGDWSRAWNGVKELFSGVFGSLLAIAKAPLNGIIGLLNAAISGINLLIDGINTIGFDMPDWLGGGSFHPNIGHIGKIPYLANGGVLSQGSAVVGEAGPELLTMSGSKAVVQPLSGNTTNTNLGGVNISVYGAPGQDVHELASIVMDEMQAATDRRGAVFA